MKTTLCGGIGPEYGHCIAPARSNVPDAASSRAIREQREADGLCTSCGTRRPAKNRKTCKGCLEKRKTAAQQRRATDKSYIQRDKERKAEWKAAGLCIQCGKLPAADGRVKCDQHLRETRERVKNSKKSVS